MVSAHPISLQSPKPPLHPVYLGCARHHSGSRLGALSHRVSQAGRATTASVKATDLEARPGGARPQRIQRGGAPEGDLASRTRLARARRDRGGEHRACASRAAGARGAGRGLPASEKACQVLSGSARGRKAGQP
ncbi:Hypothetical predicted protein [Marmota monax]|uniref:Uncharacterized protein n=1 Tax=Marmota monax TaxID=9995 RepID=A0A5E4B648_MARMO|nr:Hypothetical predicted protein [Marmota monax]